MGYSEFIIVMESRIGRVSSGLGSSPGIRGQALKSSPFCPRSASKLTQSIIKDHMVSHYKKVYSAKAAIDTSVPKSLIHSVKYNDQIRKDHLRKGGRPQSAHSFSQRNTRASCSSAQSRLSVQYDDSPYLCSTSSVVSSTRISTSFHVKDIIYPSCKVTSQNHSHQTRPASEIQYRNPEAVLQRKQSVCSLPPSGESCYKIFQDPVQKTYSGDLLQKHSQHFTPDKPFTPKTLKSDKSSYLSKYRYYRAPQKKPTQDRTNLRSTKSKEYTQEFEDQFQGFNKEPEWSENEFSETYFSPSRQQSQANKSRDHYLFDSSFSLSPEGGTSPIMKSVSAEEEELMYLTFISAVTEDMLSRGHISDRVLDRVIMRHIDMNRHQLDEGKMRHLLEVLRKDFEKPISISNSSTETEKKDDDLFDTLLPHLESVEKQIPKTKEDNDIFPAGSSEEKNEECDIQENCTGSPLFHENLTNNTGIIEEDSHQNQTGLTITSKEVSRENHEKTTVTIDQGFHQDQAEVSYERQSTELEDLGRSLSVSLHVSNNTDCKNMETASEQHTNTVASVSDDEF